MIAAYTVAALLVVGVAAGALASAWHHAHYRPVTDLRRRQLEDVDHRYGVHDPRPPT
jgi:hypothetical protein